MNYPKPSLNANRFRISELYVPLSCFTDTSTFLVKAVEAKFEYNEDKKAEKKLEGYRYTLIDVENFITFDIIAYMDKAIITQDKINALGKNFARVAISLDETYVHPYDYDKGEMRAKVTTSHIEIVK